MRTITSSSGLVETVTVRRSESSDAVQICQLLSPDTAAVFGRVNVIYLLEKANLAVTLSTAKNQILAHAAFLDHPIGDLVDQASWEELLQTHFNRTTYTPLNTLFLHLFVAQSSFAAESSKEIIRTVFSAITELEYICLLTPYSSCLEPALGGIFEPMDCVTEGIQCAAFVCNRHNHCPKLHVRKARVDDHDDITTLFVEQTKALASSYGPHFLADLIEAQDEANHVAVCENEGIAVGFISVSTEVNLALLNQYFELSPFDGLLKKNLADQTNDTEQPQQDQPTKKNAKSDPEIPLTQSESKKGPDIEGSEKGSECGAGVSATSCDISETEPIRAHTIDCTRSNVGSEPAQSPNAFCIQLFAIKERFKMRSVDFLPYVFEVFPERDFCIISVPKLDSEFPLLQPFLRVAPRPFSSLPQELYIFHRTGLLKMLLVRVPVCDDMTAVKRLIQDPILVKTMTEDLDMFLKARRDPDGTPIKAFVVEIEKQIIGIVVIREEKDIEYIRANYNIENFVYFSQYQLEEHGRLCHFALIPTFQHYTRHILKEVLRLAHKSCLYHPVYPNYYSEKENNAFAYYLTASPKCMVPVHPRRQIIYPLEELGVNAPSTLITKQQVPYALNHFTRKLTFEPKVTINARIVVVGASDTGIAFLESLVFCPHLQFNNLTLISTHGLPDYHSTDSTTFLTTSHCYSEHDYALLALSSWVNVVMGKMTAIDRAAKHVQVSKGRAVPYDHLVLCTGQQYQIPCPTGIDISKWSAINQMPIESRCRKYTGHVPSNFFTLNCQNDCTQAYSWLQKNLIEKDGNAVIYGNSTDMYSCVETLLSLGVRGSRIHVVHTPADPQYSFKNSTVDQAVRRAVKRKEVHVHHNCLLAQLNDGQHPEPLTAVSFTTDGQPLSLDVAVFFNFSCKGVDFDTFKAINDACLVFDGRLVIDTTFHTNDCAIRAAGPLTKYSRRYFADQWSHSVFNSKEVGQELASVMLPFFDPTLEMPSNPAPDVDRLIPLYKQPKIQGGRLPGGYSYLHVAKPSPYTITASSADTSGREIVTGRVETGNYFHLQFNTQGLLETFTCLSHKTLPVSNYLCLYGKHQLLLNSLYDRFDKGLVHDLYSYFRETCCMAIFHDRFADFKEEVCQIMESTAKVQVDQDLVSIPELTEMIVDGTWMAPEKPSLYLNQMFKNSEGQKALKRSVLDYLKYNKYHLPMYAQPRLL